MSRRYDNFLRREYERKYKEKTVSEHTIAEYIKDVCNEDAGVLLDNILQALDITDDDIKKFCKEKNLKNMDELVARCKNATEFWESVAGKINGWDWYCTDSILLAWYGE
jgi:CBS-domain-containing membrane protein